MSSTECVFNKRQKSCYANVRPLGADVKSHCRRESLYVDVKSLG